MKIVDPKTQGDTARNLRPQFSSESLDLPWEIINRQQRPYRVHENQFGRQITASGFYLYFIAFLLLTTGTALFALSIWSLSRKIPITYLIDVVIDIPYFSIPGALLCYPCFWIAASMSNQKNYPFLPLLLIIMVISIVLLSCGLSFGFVYRSVINSQLYSTIVKEEFIQSLGKSFLSYCVDPNQQKAWDLIQTRLECCGIFNSTDWIETFAVIPGSCCNHQSCTLNNTYQNSCLNAVIYDLHWQKNILFSISGVVILMEIISICLSTAIYFFEKRRK